MLNDMGTHYNGTPEEIRALNVYIKLTRAADAVHARVNQHLTDHNLTVSQFGVLEAVYHLGPLCQKDIAAKVLKSTGNITFVIDNLEKRALVERRRNPDDRRMVDVYLTDAGRALIEEILPGHVALIAEDISILTPEEQAELQRLCRKLGLRES